MLNKVLEPKYHPHIVGVAFSIGFLSIVIAGYPFLIVAQTPTTSSPTPTTTQTGVPNVSHKGGPVPESGMPSKEEMMPSPSPIMTTPEITPEMKEKMMKEGGQGVPERMEATEPPEEPEEFVNPREIQNALADIKRMRGELGRFIAQLKRMKNNQEFLAQIGVLSKQLQEFEANIKANLNNPSELRAALQDFWEARMWEEVNKIRAAVELPRQLTEIQKSLVKVERLIKNKSFQKLGFNMESLRNNLAEMRKAFEEAQTLYKQGDLEEAMEALQSIHEQGHPGEIEGTLHMMREIQGRLKQIRIKEIKTQLSEIIAPIIEAFDDGDFRSAREMTEDLRAELQKLYSRILRLNKGLRENKTDIIQKFEALEKKILEKIQKGETEEESKEE